MSMRSLAMFKKAFARFIKTLFCTHEWVFDRRIREQNLRASYYHFSNVFHCEHCRKHRTEEVPTERL